jgi:Tol biopolymer transport system component
VRPAGVATMLLLAVAFSACGSSAPTATKRQENGPIVVAASGGSRPPGIYRLDPDRTLRRLTTGEHDVFPTWSRDGSQIAFMRIFTTDGMYKLFVMNRDGGEPRAAGEIRTSGQFSWSADGETFAYDGDGGIRMVGIDGAGDRLLYRSENTHEPAWSPDGNTLVFGESPKGLVVVDADGGSARTVVETPSGGADDIYILVEPTPSPDGRRIAFIERKIGLPDPNAGSLVVVNADGSGRRTVTKLGSYGGSSYLVRPTWSPDGRIIAFTDKRGKRYGIWTVPSSGGEPHLLLEGRSWEMPSWGPA